MADEESRNSVSFGNFKFISLNEYLGDTRKVTRKKHLLNARHEQLFLPEGHSSCILWENKTGDREQKSVGIAFTGGARHKEPST